MDGMDGSSSTRFLYIASLLLALPVTASMTTLRHYYYYYYYYNTAAVV